MGVFPFLIVSFIKLFTGTTEWATRVFRLKSFLTVLSTRMSINYTEWTVCPSFRESSRSEWSVTNLFLSVKKKKHYHTQHTL
jgi:hypothetical protein